jgi:hypothetical protein
MALARQETPTPKTAATPTPETTPPSLQPAGNAAMQEQLQAPPATATPSGPLGRMWNRILGKPEGTDSSGAVATTAQVRAYLDGIGLAEGELFRGMKLDGVAEGLMKQYDADKDGRISWTEFQGFAEQLTSILVGPTGADAEHGATDNAPRDGQASLKEIQARTAGKLPKDTDHRDLVAQLGARAVLDAADTDQGDRPVSKRTLSKEEWTSAAKGLGKQ